ncbi:unnamed protein product [Caenorhabditis bovis]|uniref:Calcineurin-like phosphoesterase domain-containing protein n=1 Tax=Caenorhabditis bovis TaxID=2654633 RepID=A0A8S1EBR7_9PELO|nr:unnamed protein product [Caenorhabditis bovis]
MMIQFIPFILQFFLILFYIPCSLTGEMQGSTSLKLIVTADTQYHFMCENMNFQCKAISRNCRDENDFPMNLELDRKVNVTIQAALEKCIALESRYANRVQRRSILDLIEQHNKTVKGLIINGDLTNFGHTHQLEEFKKGWIDYFPVPVYVGLGNHDYQNNVNDCVLNYCAHTMLSWFTTFTRKHSIYPDIHRKTNGFSEDYKGSLAYTERICDGTGKVCVFMIQLNNAIDYTVKIDAFIARYELTSPLEYLKKELDLIVDSGIPILINVHQCEGLSRRKLRSFLESFIGNNQAKNPKIAVLFGHMHRYHEIYYYCMHDQRVPFIYAGSVPNNRFSILEFLENKGYITGYSALDPLVYKDQTLKEHKRLELFGDCLQSPHVEFSKTFLHILQEMLANNRTVPLDYQ